jgi:hypothetical protein
MKYYVQEAQKSKDLQRTAGIKARDDLDDIFNQIHVQAVNIPPYDAERETYSTFQKIKAHFTIVKEWEKKLDFLKKGDTLFVQFPIIGHSIFQARVIKQLEKRGIRVVLIIHDLEILRAAKKKDVSGAKSMRLKWEEKNTLQVCSKIIVHNSKMKKYMIKLGIPEEKMVSLEIFDYLIPEYDQKKADVRVLEKEMPVIIAGNLRPHKAQYLYHLNDCYSFNLYGVGYQGVQNEKISYFGSFPSNELPYVMSGSFGLVWDGEETNTCSGVYGEYLKINNPHKTSLYLASGIPVVIWEEAALAEFVKKNKCGIMIKSLDDLKQVILKLSVEQYKQLKQNAEMVGERLRSGYYTKEAVKNCH